MGSLDLLIQSNTRQSHPNIGKPSTRWVPWTYSAKPTQGCTSQQNTIAGHEGETFGNHNRNGRWEKQPRGTNHVQETFMDIPRAKTTSIHTRFMNSSSENTYGHFGSNSGLNNHPKRDSLLHIHAATQKHRRKKNVRGNAQVDKNVKGKALQAFLREGVPPTYSQGRNDLFNPKNVAPFFPFAQQHRRTESGHGE